MAINNRSKLVKGSVVGALVLALSGCEVIGLIPMAVYGASLSVEDMLEKREIRAEIQDLEDSGVIPKIDETDTRAGIDSDNNGIRDDIDHLIKSKAQTEKELLAMEQIAKGFQVVQNTKEESLEVYREFYETVHGGKDCLFWLDSWNTNKASRTFYLIKEMTTNTKKRKKRQINIEKFSQNSMHGYISCNLNNEL